MLVGASHASLCPPCESRLVIVFEIRRAILSRYSKLHRGGMAYDHAHHNRTGSFPWSRRPQPRAGEFRPGVCHRRRAQYRVCHRRADLRLRRQFARADLPRRSQSLRRGLRCCWRGRGVAFAEAADAASIRMAIGGLRSRRRCSMPDYCWSRSAASLSKRSTGSLRPHPLKAGRS